MSQGEQQVIDRRTGPDEPLLSAPSHLGSCTGEQAAEAERAARTALRAQIARLERELSWIVAEAFPRSIATSNETF